MKEEIITKQLSESVIKNLEMLHKYLNNVARATLKDLRILEKLIIDLDERLYELEEKK